MDQSQDRLGQNVADAILVKTSSGLKCAGQPDKLTQLLIKSPALCSSIAIAANDKIVGVQGSRIKEFSSPKSYLEHEGIVLEDLEDIIQITANQATFTALSRAGQVWSWGDNRYEACLGREVTGEM
jgi:alpha-tubulin suppressor-like RCC1 family protein